MVCYLTHKVTEIEEDKQLTILIALLFQVYLNIQLITVGHKICNFLSTSGISQVETVIPQNLIAFLILTQPLMTEYKMIAQVIKQCVEGSLTLLWPTT